MIYGLTKGTDFEKICDGAAKAEAALEMRPQPCAFNAVQILLRNDSLGIMYYIIRGISFHFDCFLLV